MISVAALFKFIELHVDLLRVEPGGPRDAAFDGEVFALHHGQKADLAQDLRGGVRERLADMRARVVRFIDDEMIHPGARQIRPEHRTGGAAADNNHIGVQFLGPQRGVVCTRGARHVIPVGRILPGAGLNGAEPHYLKNLVADAEILRRVQITRPRELGFDDCPDRGGPRAHDDDAIRQLHCLVYVVGDEEDGLLLALPYFHQLRAHAQTRQKVERPERLVHVEDIGAAGESARDLYPLLHAAGKLARV